MPFDAHPGRDTVRRHILHPTLPLGDLPDLPIGGWCHALVGDRLYKWTTQTINLCTRIVLVGCTYNRKGCKQ
jgi:hypothetical protein